MKLKIVEGDIAEQTTDAVVNAWNCNFIPWFLLLPQGVSRAIRKKAGTGPFWELLRKGPMRPGTAVATGPGRMSCRHLIHVAGINPFWIATERSVGHGTASALRLALDLECRSIAYPVLGSGTGGFEENRALEIMKHRLGEFSGAEIEVIIVRYRPDGAFIRSS